jgi:Tol biopolymer transport system component
MRRGVVFWVLSLVLALALTGGAGRAFAMPGPVSLISKDAIEQADEAEAPAISADGRFIAFQATIGGRKGVFRKDLESGAIVAVATGDAYERADLDSTATAPSISADGRYVSFTTKAPLDLADDGAEPEDSDVYVADMSTSPPTYEMASARDGCVPSASPVPCGLTYEAGGEGSVAAGRVAISADGREVAFVVSSKSDLVDPPGQPETPAGQVVVRDLDTDRTTLVSVERDPLTGAMTTLPVEGGAVVEEFGKGAALSADGTTVAWLGGNLGRQVLLLPDEAQQIELFDSAGSAEPYDEPLWRRIADGPAAPTRRIVGGEEPPRFPGLVAPTDRIKVCSKATGWLTYPTSPAEGLPSLSADGRLVALVGEPDDFANLFVAEMAPGSGPAQAVRQYTAAIPIQQPCQAGTAIGSLAGSAPLVEAAISPAGNRVAFSTTRQQFPLSPPHLATQAPPKPGLEEVYVLDLGTETIERLTPTDRGEASTSEVDHPTGARSLAFDGDGEQIAFASVASNVVEGDANGASDVFVVTDPFATSAPGQTSISPPPPHPQPTVRWQLTASAVSLPGGRVKVRAVVPGAGRLQVKATAQVGAKLKRRRVAAAAGRAGGEGLLRLVVKLKPAYRRLAKARPGLAAVLRLGFNGPGGKPLHAVVSARFSASAKKAKPGQKAGGRR